jgi:hypothetical protein
MEPIANQLREFLASLGFDKRKIQIDISYDNKLVKDKLHTTAHIKIDGPIDGEI